MCILIDYMVVGRIIETTFSKKMVVPPYIWGELVMRMRIEFDMTRTLGAIPR